MELAGAFSSATIKLRKIPNNLELTMYRAVFAGVYCALAIGLTFQLRAEVKPVTVSKDFVVATINGMPIMESNIKNFHTTLPPQYRQLPYQQIRGQLIERVIEQQLIADAARKRGFHNTPTHKNRIASIERSLLNEAYMSQALASEITEANIREIYQKSIALQPKSTEVRARHILVNTKTEAMEVISQLLKGADFLKLAKEKSTGPSGKNGGDLGYFGPGQMVPPFSKAAFKLNKGEFTKEPVKTQFGYHVIKVEDRRVSGKTTYEQASKNIRADLQEKIFKRIISGLRANAKIEMKGGTSKIQLLR